MLASALKSLIENELVSRKSYDEIPPRVEYSLTKSGLSVVPMLQSICVWAGAYYKNENDTSMIQCRNVTTIIEKYRTNSLTAEKRNR